MKYSLLGAHPLIVQAKTLLEEYKKLDVQISALAQQTLQNIRYHVRLRNISIDLSNVQFNGKQFLKLEFDLENQEEIDRLRTTFGISLPTNCSSYLCFRNIDNQHIILSDQVHYELNDLLILTQEEFDALVIQKKIPYGLRSFLLERENYLIQED